MNPYETTQYLHEYLFFHFGEPHEFCPYPFAPKEALNFPQRIVRECLFPVRFRSPTRGLDVGCAVGGTTFELAGVVDHALGVDNSTQFIRAARQLGRTHRARIRVRLEGDRNARRAVVLPRRLRSVRATFAVGDAQHLAPACRGPFHVVLAINLIDRLPRPRKFLAQLGELVVPGGQLVIASPYTWMEQFTPRREWLCRAGQSSSAALDSILGPSFRLVRRRHLPFLIREHARKYQWCVSEASTYVRRA